MNRERLERTALDLRAWSADLSKFPWGFDMTDWFEVSEPCGTTCCAFGMIA